MVPPLQRRDRVSFSLSFPILPMYTDTIVHSILSFILAYPARLSILYFVSEHFLQKERL